MTPTERRVTLAQVGAPHGVRGEVRLKVFAEDPDILTRLPLALPDGRALRVTQLRALKGEMFVARLEGVTTREGAGALKLKLLDAPRGALPEIEAEDDFYIADLVGLEARDEAGARVGAVRAVHDFGAGDILELRRDDPSREGEARDMLIPFTRTAVPAVDIAGGFVVIARQDETEDDAPDDIATGPS